MRSNMQLTRGQTVQYWLGADEEPIACALRDLEGDFERVLGARLRRTDDAARASPSPLPARYILD